MAKATYSRGIRLLHMASIELPLVTISGLRVSTVSYRKGNFAYFSIPHIQCASLLSVFLLARPNSLISLSPFRQPCLSTTPHGNPLRRRGLIMLWTRRRLLPSTAAEISSEFGSGLHTLLYTLEFSAYRSLFKGLHG